MDGAVVREPRIVINGLVLAPAHAMAVRVAVSSFRQDREHLEELGDFGRLYDQRLAEVERVMFGKCTCGAEERGPCEVHP